jgi:hypothetical protein
MTELEATLGLEGLGTVPLSNIAELHHLQEQIINLSTVQKIQKMKVMIPSNWEGTPFEQTIYKDGNL